MEVLLITYLNYTFSDSDDRNYNSHGFSTFIFFGTEVKTGRNMLNLIFNFTALIFNWLLHVQLSLHKMLKKPQVEYTYKTFNKKDKCLFFYQIIQRNISYRNLGRTSISAFKNWL